MSQGLLVHQIGSQFISGSMQSERTFVISAKDSLPELLKVKPESGDIIC